MLMSDEKDISGIRLNPDEVKKIADHFNDHIGNRSCHICGTRKWNPLPSVYTQVVFDRKHNHHRADRVMPQVCVACRNCGAITSFFAEKVGIQHVLLDETDKADES